MKMDEKICSHKSDRNESNETKTKKNGTEQNKVRQNQVDDIYINLSLRFRKMKCLWQLDLM